MEPSVKEYPCAQYLTKDAFAIIDAYRREAYYRLRHEQEPMMARNGKKLVLVVDDDRDQQHAFARAFSRHEEIELLQAYTPLETISKLESNIRDIDLVILDEDLGAEQISSPDLAEEILAKGYIGFMISMSLKPKEERDTRMMHAGCRESVHKKSAVSLALDLLRIERRYGLEDEA